jgi:hypothetical protein
MMTRMTQELLMWRWLHCLALGLRQGAGLQLVAVQLQLLTGQGECW